ncbi:MAG: rhomboid family intramembrane serine protease [Gammaproteobacteria bacterium]
MNPHDPAFDPEAGRQADRRRLRRAFLASAGFALLLLLVYSAQPDFDWRAWSVRPGSVEGLRGLLGAPLLHGSGGHLAANTVALLLLGTLAGSVYPRATVPALPLLWLGSGLGAWLLGEPGSHHLGASGLGHGLMFLVFVLGLLRRDRPAIAAALIAFFLYGSMLLTVLPQAPGVSWQSHLGGALAGVACAFWLRRRDPQPPRRRYSWELEEEAAQAAADAARAERETLEPPAPREVPVLWRREPEPRGQVLPLPPRPRPPRRP